MNYSAKVEMIQKCFDYMNKLYQKFSKIDLFDFNSRNRFIRCPVIFTIVLCIIAIVDIPWLNGQQINESIIRNSYHQISSDPIRNHIFFLGSDSLEGRGTGTKGEKVAAKYIARHLKELNLVPLGDNNTYFQSIPMHGSQPLAGSRLQIISQNNTHYLELGKDYLLYKTGAQTFVPNPVPVIFVGYGIIAPEYDYNDYQSMDVEGKIVAYLEGEPKSSDPSYFDGENPTIYSLTESKQRFAISRGARGSILIPNKQANPEKNWQKRVREFSFENVKLAYRASAQLSLVLNPKTAELLFHDIGYSLNQIYTMHANNTMHSFKLSAQLSFRGKFYQRDFLANNVIGLLEGRKLEYKDSYLILSAHYDHLGIGLPVQRDSIYNGVIDNASGVAALLEIARIFTSLPEPPKRSVLFMFVTGEEKGLLGSQYYLDHPAVPLYKTIANINIDGLALFDTFNNVVGIGAQYSTLDKFLKTVAAKVGLRVSPIPNEFLMSRSFFRSDQIAFAKTGIPSLLIMEGLDYRNHTRQEGLTWFIRWSETIYHSPFDDFNQSLNFKAAKQHCHVLFSLAYQLTECDSVPKWNPETPFINARLQSIAEKR